jgi:hypothetical protein
MYNTDLPTKAELPTTAQLIKSSILAGITAAVLTVTVVLPSEYAIDPTGIGRALQLTQMGEIKQQLAAEAAADRIKDQEAERLRQQQQQPAPRSSLANRIFAELFIGSARAQSATRSDETVITLKPTEGGEWKLTMAKGATAQYSFTVQGGAVNYDLHGTPRGGGKETSYKTGRGVASETGTVTAGFDGSHGWFFRNRGSQPVTITLKTSGAYSEIKKVQ